MKCPLSIPLHILLVVVCFFGISLFGALGGVISYHVNTFYSCTPVTMKDPLFYRLNGRVVVEHRYVLTTSAIASTHPCTVTNFAHLCGRYQLNATTTCTGSGNTTTFADPIPVYAIESVLGVMIIGVIGVLIALVHLHQRQPSVV